MNKDTRKNENHCVEIRERLTLYVLQDLDAGTQEAIRTHLESCKECRALEKEIRETIGTLQDALAGEPAKGFVTLLAKERRQNVRKAFARRKLSVWTRVLQSPAMKIAASLMVGYLLISLLMPALDRGTPASFSVRVIDPAPSEHLDDVEHVFLGVDPRYAGLPDSAAMPPAFVGQTFPDLPVPAQLDIYADIQVDDLAPLAPAEAAQVQPAEFDSVAQVGSPVVMRGMHGSRSPGLRGETPPDAVDDDIAIDIVHRPAAAPVPQSPASPPSRSRADRARDRLAELSASLPERRSGEDVPVPVEADGRSQVGRESVADAFTVSGVVSRGDFLVLAGGAEVMELEESAEHRMRFESRPDVPLAEWRGRLQEIRIPEMSFRQTPVSDVVQFLNAQLLEYGEVGTPVLDASSMGETALTSHSDGDQTLITFTVQDISALQALELIADVADLQVATDGEKLRLQPRAAADGLLDQTTPDAFAPRFRATGVNPFVSVAENAFSTFSIDVNTASYTLSRNYMLAGRLPPPEAVRTEEFVNFFDYAYEAPIADTFRVVAEVAPSRFGRGLHMLKIGVKGRRLGREEQRPAVLTFLIDSSGSMEQPDRLGLVRESLTMLLDGLAPTDQVAIIQFASRARLVLGHTPVSEREQILSALNAIQCGGGTNLEAGLLLAYEQAAQGFVSGGENRILLMSDGFVNMGETEGAAIFERVERYRRQGLYLSVFGVGMGLYDDTMLKTLAVKGNGAYAFIDSEQEARRVFVEDLSATLNTIAEDVKIQVEFNPAIVHRFRQLGYESRQLTREQFRDDTVDAGEVGSGQSVTALYELDMMQSMVPVPYMSSVRGREENERWLAVIRVRYRRVDNGRIEEIEQRIYERDIASFDAASPRFRLAAGVAAFAEILRGSPFVQGVGFADVAEVLRPVALELHLDKRVRELAQIVETAGGLAT